MSNIGRPTKFDDLRQKRILDAIGKGLSRTAAAAKARISRTALQEWISRGRSGEQPFADFVIRVKEAEAKAEEAMVTCVRTAALEPRHWTAAAWWLERCRPTDYAKRDATPIEELERAESEETDLSVAESVLAAIRSRKTGTDGQA